MPATVHLNDIIDALEVQLDESLSYLDLDAGQVVTVSADLLRDAEEHGDEEPDVPDWSVGDPELVDTGEIGKSRPEFRSRRLPPMRGHLFRVIPTQGAPFSIGNLPCVGVRVVSLEPE